MSEVVFEQWVMMDRGVPTSIYEQPVGSSGLDVSGNPQKSTELYDPAIHTIQDVPEAADFVNKDIFLFELLTTDEQLTLQFHVKNIDTLGEWDQPIPSVTGGLYRGLDLASQQLDNVEQVQLSSPRTLQFLNLCGYLGVFTSDAAVQAQRIADIQIARKPDGTYINK
jgi:hypothetical protein